MSRVLFFILLSVIFSSQCDSARILGLFTAPSKSHILIHTAIIDALVERGHEATVVTTVPIPKPKNYRHLQLKVSGFPKDFISKAVNNPEPFYKRFGTLIGNVVTSANASLHQPEMKILMEKDTFDLVILGYFFNEFQLGVAAHFKCPVIVSFMVQPIRVINDMVGNPKEMAYVPNLFGGGVQPLGFWGRVKNFLFINFFEEILYPLLSARTQVAFYNYNFPPDKYPSLDDMRKNISLVLTNHHQISQGPIRPDVPAMVEIGGIQIKEKPDPLPEDIKTILDNAKHGAIYLSFGSNIQGDILDKTKAKAIFNVLSKLKQTVLWKWGESDFPGQAPNIVYKAWVPQDDVLAHPNVKLFITHGGQGSVVESEYHGVPMVGIPLFGEQNSNMANVEKSGFGLKVDFVTISEESLGGAIREVLSNKIYRDNVQRFAKLYKDRPMSAKQTAVYWVEYVLRHRGAPHMQSPAVHLNSFQLMSLDVIAFLLAVIYVVFKVLKVTFKFICCRSRKTKTE